MATAQEAHQEDHQSFIKTPKQLAWVMVLAFVVPVLALIMIANFVLGTSKARIEAGMSDAEIRARIAPVAQVALDLGGGQAAGAKVEKSGEEVYKTVCAACHGTGAAGAHKFGDKAAWAPHLKEGLAALAKNAINGIRGMPARGGNPALTDLEVTRAVVYMANAAGANFKEPEAPAAKPAPAAAPAAAAGAAAAPAPAAPAGASGEAVYKQACAVCHATGVAGAPKLGDKAQWAPRIGAGVEALYASVIKGKGAMPAKGGNVALSDAEVKAAVDFIVAAAK